ncbi:MAG: glycosyltransferase [Ferruginibacter sp.]|nr:glycosyltransferase [Ferruginibacter sp.]
MIKSKSIINILLGMEKFILRQADTISSISYNMMMKMQVKCDKKVIFFPNWVDVEQFFPVENKDGLKTLFGFAENDTVILYSGSIGQKQGLEQILHAGKHFQFKPSIKFVICGDGPYKTNLQKLSADLKLNNVYFLPLQPLECFNNFLNMADFHLVLQKANAGDLVLPSKLTTVLAIGGVSLVSASPGTSLFDIINNNKVGYIIKPEDQQSFNLVLEEAIGSDNNTITYNAREYANNFLSINSILNTYANNALNSVPVRNVYSSQNKVYENSSTLKKFETM